MTTSGELIASDPLVATRSVAARRYALSRNEFFAGLFIVGCANGLLGRVIQSVDNADSWMGAITGLDLNVVVLFAAFAGISVVLSAEGERQEVRSADLATAAVFLILVALPIFPLSWVAVTGLSFYILLFAKERSDRVRGALILLALSVPMLWSRLLFQFFAKPILDIDATLVAALLGTHQVGNMVRFADDSGYMVVLAPCSSLANMSLAFLCWISVTQWAKHRWTKMDIFWSLLACVSVIAVNVTRISLMGVSQAHYKAIHSESGDLIVNTVMLLLMVGITVLGCRREIFARL